MKKWIWVALPSIIISVYFIYIGITKVSNNLLFSCIWLMFSGIAFYQSFKILRNQAQKKAERQEHDVYNEVSNRLREVEQLYNQGLITRDELDEQRKKIIDNISSLPL